jgi:hypothetical protein
MVTEGRTGPLPHFASQSIPCREAGWASGLAPDARERN